MQEKETKERREAARIRDKILEGYQDALQGRIFEYRGNLSQLLKEAKLMKKAKEPKD